MTDVDAGAPPGGGDRTEPVNIQVEMQRSYIDYAMSVIVGRALPDVRDGLKPVHVRILWAMYDGGYRPDRGYFKCSRVVGDVMGQYHPHGDSAIYDALVRLAQPWSMRMPLIDSQGNFGSPGNDPPAAMRYTECRLAPLAMEMLRDIDKDTVDVRPNYDGRSSEPVVLPSRFPNLLVNGSEGIAVGMATKIPPHNLREVAAGVQWYLENFDATDEELLAALIERVKGPDFPTRALIVGRRGIEEAYRTGRGSITMRAVVTVDEDRRGRTCLIVTELPYQVNPDNLAAKIAELVRDGRVNGISELRDETSGRTGQRLVIVLKRDAVAKVVLNNLYKHTQLQETFGANMLALVDGVPRTLRLDQMVRHWVTHQIDVVVRRTRYLLRKAEERAHIVRALLKAIDRIDEVIALIRGSESASVAQQGLMDLLEIDEEQARAILDMQLRRLAALERQQLIDEYDELMAKIADYEAILASPERQRQIVSEELAEIVTRYGDDRRTQLVADEGEVLAEDLIAQEDVVVTITRGGYAKRTKTDLYRAQRRGGKGVRGAQLRTDDIVEHFFVTSTHDWILFFTNKGRVYRAKAYELPDTARDARGQHVANLLAFQPDERIAEVHGAAGLLGRALPGAGHPVRHGEEVPADRLRLAPHRRDHRDQPPRGRRGHRGPAGLPGPGPAAGQQEGAGDQVPRDRRGAPPDGAGHLRRDRHAVRERRRAARHARGQGRRRRAGRHQRRLRQADPGRPVPGQGPGRHGRADGADRRRPRRAGRGAHGRSRRRGFRDHLVGRGDPDRGRRGEEVGPADHGGPADEPRRRRQPGGHRPQRRVRAGRRRERGRDGRRARR